MNSVTRLDIRRAAVTTTMILAALLTPALASADAVHYGYVWKKNADGRWEDRANWNCINPAGGGCNPAENKGYPNLAGDEAYFDAGIYTRRLSVAITRTDIRVAKIVLGTPFGINFMGSGNGQIILTSGVPAPAEIVTTDQAVFDPFGLTQFFVPFVNESPLLVTTGANAQLLFHNDIGPYDNGLIVRGPGETILGRPTTYTGPTIVESGTLTLNGSPDTPGVPIVLSRDLVIGAGAQAVIARPHQLVDTMNVTVNAGLLKCLAEDRIADLTLNGGTAYVQPVNQIARLVTRNVLVNGGTVNVSSGARFVLTGDVTVGGANGTFTYDTLPGSIVSAIELGGGLRRFTLNGSLFMAIRMVGAGGMIKDGPGTLFFVDGPIGQGPSTFAGETRIVQGTVEMSSEHTAVPANLTLGHNGLPAQVIVNRGGISQTSNVDVGPLGTLVARAPFVGMRSLALSPGAHFIQNAPTLTQVQFNLVMSGSADIDIQQGTLWVRDLLFATSNATHTPHIRGNGTLLAPQQLLISDGPQAVDLRIATAINNGGVSPTIRKDEPGLLELTAANGFSSMTVVSGTVRVGTVGAIPNFARLTLSDFPDPGTVDLNNFDVTVAALNGDGGRILLGARTLTIDQRFDPTATYGGAILGTGRLVKTGFGAQTLAGSQPNTFTGLTTVQAGKLVLGKSIQKATIVGPVVVTAGTLEMAANNQFADTSTITLNAPGVFDVANTLATIASLDGNGEVRLGTGTLTLGTGRSTVFSGTMNGAAAPAGLPAERYFRLIKAGLSTFTLTGTLNLGDQAVVDRGVLTLDTQLNGRGVTVRNGSSLAGTGRIASVSTLSAITSGTIAPGHGNPGILRADAAEITGGFLIIQVTGTGAGTGYDQLDLTGTLMLGAGARLLWRPAVTVPRNSVFTVVKVGTTTPVRGTFNGLLEGATFAANGQSFRITYRGGDGNDVVVTALDGPANLTTATYYLPEGVTGKSHDEDVLIANPNDSPAPVTLTFTKESGEQILETRIVPALSRLTVHVDQIPGLESTRVSAEVRSDSGMPLAVERAAFWDETYYGGHTAMPVEQPVRDWYFAEGAETSTLHTFVSLANPNATPADVTVTFFREKDAPVQTTLAVNAWARVALRASDFPDLAGRGFGFTVHATQPILAERSTSATAVSMGSAASLGSPAASTQWYFAEGATGDSFDTLFLLTNPHDTAAEVSLTYMLDDGVTVTVPKTIPANGRLTTNVEAERDPRLRDARFSTVVRSEMPIVAERSMRWQDERHESLGAVEPGTRWALAEGRAGGAQKFRTSLTLANLQTTAATVTVTFLREGGEPVEQTYSVAAMSRLDIDVSDVPGMQESSFGAEVRVTNDVPIVVERSMYWSANGDKVSGGGSVVATRLP